MSRRHQPQTPSPLTVLLLKLWRLISYCFLGLGRSLAHLRQQPFPKLPTKSQSQKLGISGWLRYWRSRWQTWRTQQRRQFRTRPERIKRFILTALTTFIFAIQFTGLELLFTIKPALAATTIAIEPITWDFVGLDSNKPESQGPNTYVVGARVCNLGTEDALNVTVKFNKDGVDNGYAFIQLQAGDTYTFDRIPADDGSAPIRATNYVFDTRANGSLPKSKYQLSATPQYCQDFYYNFEVTRTASAWNTYQKYYIEASGSNTNYVATERPRQNYIEKLISQARNEVYYFGCDPAGGSTYATGAVTVQVGDTFTCEARAHTASAYPQMSFTADIPNVIFQVLKVNSTYSNPTGGINSTVYADGCGWVNDPTDPRYHLSPGACSSETGFTNTYSDQYPYTAPPAEGKGAVGNDIVTRYTIKVLAFPNGIPNPIRVSNVMLDYSGSSYHYNADYGIAPNLIDITVANPSPTDLSVTKTHSGNFSYGDNTYTLTVSDNANGTAAKSPVILTDTLPAGYTFKDMNATKVGIQPLSGANAANWNCNTSGQIMTCLYDTNGDSVGDNFPDGGTNTLTLNVNIAIGAVPSGSTSTNFARVTLNSAQTDSNTTNNTASDPTTVLALPNLVLAKTSSPAPPTKFELGVASASYTLTATNSSLFNIAGPLTLVDNLPPGITFNSVDAANTSAGWSCNATDATKQTVICTNSSGVVSGANTKVTLKVDVSGSVVDSDTGTQGIQVRNKAVISTGSAETSLTDNEATITNDVNKPAPDLSILKTDSNLDFIDNGTSYYFLTVTNVGGLPTSGTLTIRDTLPEIFDTSNVSQGRLAYSAVVDPATGAAPTNWTCSAVPSAGSSVNNDITCNSAAGFTLAPGQSSTLRIAVTVPNLPNGTFNPVTNTATITPITGEIITANNTSSDTTNILNTVNGNQSNIGISKAVTTTPSGPGQAIAYEIFAVNTDTNQNITKGLFEDIVPSQITGVTASCAVATGSGLYNGTSFNFQGAAAGNACCTLTTATDPATGGTKVSCQSNSYIQLLKKSGQNYAAVKITISGTVSQSGTVYNGASVGIDPTDAVKDRDATDNYDSVATSVPSPTLTLAKTPIPASFAQGELVTYRLTVTNPGAPNTLNSAGFLKITDPLPSQYTYVSSTSATGSSGWQCEAVGQNVTCLNGSTTLTPGQSTSVDLLLRVSGNGSSILNTATLTRPDGTTTTASNTQNIASAVPDLVITKTAANIAIAQQGTYTIKVQNIGTGKAAGPIIVRDTLPTGLSFLSGSGTGWSCTTQTSPTVDPQKVICTNYSDLAGNNTFAPDLTLNVLVGASVSGSLSNTAAVNLAPDVTIPGETAFANNTTTISTPVATTSDFAVVKTAVDQNTTLANTQFYQDGTAVYNITVTNNGPTAYSGTVTINENLGAITPSDPNFTYVSHSDSATWSCTNVATSGACATGAKNLRFAKTGGLLAGESSTITLRVNVPDGLTGTFTNTATIDAATITAANDTNTSNNSDPDTVDVLDNTTTLTLLKDDNDGESPDEPTSADFQGKFVKGGVGKYTIVARNSGPSPAKAPVTISDTLPTGLTYAGNSQTANWSCTGTLGSQNFSCIYGVWTDTDNDGDRFDPGGSLFTQQDLPVGAASGVEIRVNVLSSATTSPLSGSVYTGLITNSASVSGSNFATVNASEETAIVDPADLAVTKAIGALTAGGTGIYSINVTNNGPGISYPQIYLQDYLPTGLTYSGATSGTAGGDGSWTIIGYNDTANEVTYKRATALAVGATTTISLPVNVSANAPGSVTNFIRVGGFTPEPDYDVNTPGYQDPIQATCDSSFGTNQPVNNCFALTTAIANGVSTDLKITKIQGTNNDNPPNPAVNFNTNYTYTIQVANISGTNADTVTLTDVLPPGLDYVSYSIDAGDLSIPNPYSSTPATLNRICGYATGSRTFSCNLLRVSTAENDSDPVDITVTTKSQVSGIVPNTATVTSVMADANTSNNSEAEDVLINAGGTNTVSGTVFADANSNGIFDTGDTGTANITVRFYQDNDNDGAIDADDALIASIPSASGGTYSFSTNLTGNFLVALDTSDPDLLASSLTTPTVLDVTLGTSDVGNDFGYVPSAAQPGNVIFVKRITAVNSVNVAGFNDDTASSKAAEDNDPDWPVDDATYLRGAIGQPTSVNVAPGDEVEYTVYFLSNGGSNVRDVKFCDLIPAKTTYVPSSIRLGYDTGTLADPSGTGISLTDGADADVGTFYGGGTTAPSVCTTANANGGNDGNFATNDTGAVFVQIVDSSTNMPFATGAGTPAGSYGFVRFRVKVN